MVKSQVLFSLSLKSLYFISANRSKIRDSPSSKIYRDSGFSTGGCFYSAIYSAHSATFLPATHICLQLLLEIFIDVFVLIMPTLTLPTPPQCYPQYISLPLQVLFVSSFYNTLNYLMATHLCMLGGSPPGHRQPTHCHPSHESSAANRTSARGGGSH